MLALLQSVNESMPPDILVTYLFCTFYPSFSFEFGDYGFVLTLDFF